MEKKTKAIIDPNKPNLDFDGDDPIHFGDTNPIALLPPSIKPSPNALLGRAGMDQYYRDLRAGTKEKQNHD